MPKEGAAWGEDSEHFLSFISCYVVRCPSKSGIMAGRNVLGLTGEAELEKSWHSLHTGQ